jgi:hypothetical protein
VNRKVVEEYLYKQRKNETFTSYISGFSVCVCVREREIIVWVALAICFFSVICGP